MTRKALLEWERAAEFIHFLEVMPNLAAENFGIYMIVEEWKEKRSLIYIGLVKSERRTIFKRLNEHRNDWLWQVAKGQIYVKVSVPKSLSRGVRVDRQFIEDVESTLIFGAQPTQNDKKKKGYTLFEDMVVENRHQGVYLEPSYSTAMQSGRRFRD